MASLQEQLLKATQQTRADLLAALAPKDLIYNDLNEYVTRYRFSCQDLILNDFEFALDHEIEQKLWDAHVKVNKRYQKMLSLSRVNDGKKTPVEFRKNAKRYLDFIKASQRFYRVYIQKLASMFGGIPELEAVAHDLRLDISPAKTIVKPPQRMRRAILLTCHKTLVRLGDLSRYRETEVPGKEPSWGPAIGYYDLAGAVYPPSGVSHNQLAVIARQREQHLSAIYHLYRALAAEESHPMAKANLELEFKKVEASWTKGELTVSGVPDSLRGSGKTLEDNFMRLHARCYKGIEFAEHDELEDEVLSYIAVDVKERSLESLLNKMVLVNITAQFSASEDFKSHPEKPEEKMQALLFFLRLNVRMFFTLLQLLQSELEPGTAWVPDPSGHATTNGSSRISVVVRRILPALRQYSSWLTVEVNLRLLVNKVGDSALEVQMKEMWKTYANTLTILARVFDVAALPSLGYLLEEDADTICFKPFEENTSNRYHVAGDTDLKPNFHSQGVERQHPNMEMLGRVRDFLTIGLQLAVEKEDVPVDFVNGDFVYREEGVPPEVFASPAGHQATLASTCVRREEIPKTKGTGDADDASMAEDELSHVPSSMVNMVNNIVEDEQMDHEFEKRLLKDETTYDGFPSAISRAVYDNLASAAAGDETSYGTIGSITAADLVEKVRSFSTPQASPRPRLPSIYNSPFAPLADEEAPRPRPGTTKRHTPTHSFQNSQHGVIGSLSPAHSQQGPAVFQQQPNGYHQVESSMSSIATLSSIGWSQSLPHKGPLTTHSRRNYDINYEEPNFMSSNVSMGSTWIGTSRQAAMMQTPPNGQSNGHGG